MPKEPQFIQLMKTSQYALLVHKSGSLYTVSVFIPALEQNISESGQKGKLIPAAYFEMDDESNMYLLPDGPTYTVSPVHVNGVAIHPLERGQLLKSRQGIFLSWSKKTWMPFYLWLPSPLLRWIHSKESFVSMRL